MKISTGHKQAAWKAIYLYNNKDKQIGHLGIDPCSKGHISPQLFWGFNNKCGRINIPHLKWNSRHPNWLSNLRQFQDRLWNKLDTRY